MQAIYDQIGKDYTVTRTADKRITEKIIEQLDLPIGSKILDVGAGTGNYSQALAQHGFEVTALEPSRVMREQGKRHERLKWVDGRSECLPFESNRFDGVVMTLCMHHFSDWSTALREAVRVVGEGPISILTFDPNFEPTIWLFDYFPAFLEKDREWFPSIRGIRSFVEDSLNREIEVIRFPLPPNLEDHFAAAGWSRPEIYLEQRYRSGISSFSSVDQSQVKSGLDSLRKNLESGAWDQKYGMHRNLKSLDVGYVFLHIKTC